ncbi:MAG TPA: hypothetical protein PLL09_01240 [Flavobacterium sp.]|nr:hypothetical protein [Flavobacterium sp.]
MKIILKVEDIHGKFNEIDNFNCKLIKLDKLNQGVRLFLHFKNKNIILFDFYSVNLAERLNIFLNEITNNK